MMIAVRLRAASIVSLVLVLVLAGCSSVEERPSVAGTQIFPVPPEIADNVTFWRNVYGVWSRGKVAIHDDEYLGVVYEVADLPGPTLASYTSEQKHFVRARKSYYRGRLEGLEAQVRSGRSPSGTEKALYEKLVDAGGVRAVYGAGDRVRSQRGLRERFRRGLATSGRYDTAFRELFRSRGLPEDLAYLPHVESSFQAHARSSAGAAGMWQFTRGTGKMYMTVNGSIDERLDPVIAAEGAARYLADAYRKLGSWPLAVTSYNHGQGGMKKAKAIYGDDIGTIVRKYKGPYFKFASRNFYAEFVAAREVAGNPKKYFPEGISYQRPLSEERTVIRHSMPAGQVARHYGVSTYRLADLNMHWREPVREGRANLPAGSTVWLPAGTLTRVAGAPVPAPVALAKASPKAAPRTAARSALAMATPDARKPKPGKGPAEESGKKPAQATAPAQSPEPLVVASAKTETERVEAPSPKPVSSPAPVRKAAGSDAAKVHVVRPNETLYRVATYYELSVDELRRLNRMGPKDTNIRPGQRLRVSG